MEEEIYLIDNSDSASNVLNQISGRICRRDFWKTMLKCLLLALCGAFMTAIMIFVSPIYGLLAQLIVVTTIRYFMCAAACKRFHDFSFSVAIPLTLFLLEVVLSLVGTWESIVSPYEISDFLIPSLAVGLLNTALWLFVAGIVPPTKGMNKYGSNPLRDFDEQVQEYSQHRASC